MAIPAEGIWGFSCLVNSDTAINKILNIKGRDLAKGFIVAFSDIKHIKDFYKLLPSTFQQQIIADTEQATTYIVANNNYFKPNITGNRNTIAIRLLKPCFLYDVCNAIARPLLTTSANITGAATVTTQEQLLKSFKNCKYLDVDPKLSQKSSKIIDLVNNITIR